MAACAGRYWVGGLLGGGHARARSCWKMFGAYLTTARTIEDTEKTNLFFVFFVLFVVASKGGGLCVSVTLWPVRERSYG